MLVDPLTGVPAGVLTMVTVYSPVMYVHCECENNDDHCTQLTLMYSKPYEDNIKPALKIGVKPVNMSSWYRVCLHLF